MEFEAKRFSETSNNQEYVYGERGGIERFKKENIQSISKSAECLRMCKAEPLKSGFQK